MEKDTRIPYWWERMGTDSQRLNDQHRLSLVKAILVNHCQLTPKELSVFLNPEFTPTAEKLDETSIYANAERKIANYYNSSFPQESTQDYEEWRQRHDLFKNDFKQALTGFYEEHEIDEILSLSTIRDDVFVAQRLVGDNFFAYRRIRNAYIPDMVTSLSLIIDETGQTKVEDITHTLFDGPEDAVSQIEKSLGIDPKDAK